MNKFEIFVDVEEPKWSAAIPDIAALIIKVKDNVIARVSDEVDFLELSKNFMVNLCLSNDQIVHKLNLQFRNIDNPTNVLSFAAVDDEEFDDILQNDDIELGDIIIAYETMERQAAELEISLKDHFCHLLTHGLLHILGYDHIDPEDAVYMEQREIDVLAKLEIENPYQE